MNYFDGVHVFGTSSNVGTLEYKELFIRLAFSTTPSSDRYAIHVSVDMTACPWKLNYSDHHVSYTATRDSHDATPTHGTTSPDVRLTPLHHQTPTSTLHLHLLLMGTSRCSMSSNIFGPY